MYADDTSLYTVGRRLEDCAVAMNEALDRVNVWLRNNHLTLNVSKSNYIIFRSKRRTIQLTDCKLYIGEDEVKRVSVVKFLGVYMDEHLLWTEHENHVLKRISKFIPIIYRIRTSLTGSALRLIYNSFIYPNLTYCNSVWGSCSESRLKPLMVFKPQHERSAPLFKILNFLPLKDVNNYMELLICV